jgi:hypothetical protein
LSPRLLQTSILGWIILYFESHKIILELTTGANKPALRGQPASCGGDEGGRNANFRKKGGKNGLVQSHFLQQRLEPRVVTVGVEPGSDSEPAGLKPMLMDILLQ